MPQPARLLRQTLFDTLALFVPMRHWLPQLSLTTLKYDFLAGLTGAVMVLPQGIAFALIAGLPPEFGLYSAIVVQLIAGFFGSSLQMVTGPTVALSIVIPAIIGSYAVIGSPQYISISLTLMLLVGIIQLLFAIFRLGSLITFISHTVIIGFAAGAGFLIIVNQLPAFFGINFSHSNAALTRLPFLVQSLAHLHFPSLLVALITLSVSLIIRKYYKRLPHMLLGLIAGSATSYLINAPDKGIATLGALPSALPQFYLPSINYQLVSNLLPSATALALLGLIEAASIARSIATRTQQRIDGNQEFFGQGLANIVGSCCSCYVGSGSFNRSAINYDSGAKTPLSLLFTSLFIIAILIFAPNITRHLPLPAIAATIILAGYNLFDLKQIRLIAKTSRSEISIILVTFLSTLLINLEFAIYVGVILSLVLYLQQTAHPMITEVDFSQVRTEESRANLTVLRLDGSLFFGAMDHFQRRLSELNSDNRWENVVILAEGVNLIDVAGLETLLMTRNRLRQVGGDLFLIGMKPHLRKQLEKSPYWQALGGKTHLYETTYLGFRAICLSLDITNYRAYMKHLFRDYQRLNAQT